MHSTPPVEAFLTSFHDERPGLTSAAFGGLSVFFRGRQFPSSYEALASIVPPTHQDAHVLDIACGDGFLLSILSRGRAHRLAGIDLSEGEIRRAAARLGGAATLSLARAQSLPFADQTFDYAFCHLAMMLMNEADQVLREVHRVLKPGATLGAVVGARASAGPGLKAFIDIYSRYSRQPQFLELRFGDPRFRTAPGIQELLAPLFRDVSIDDLRISRRLTPDALWEWLLGMYDIYLLEETDRAAVHQQYLAAVVPICDADGTFPHEDALRLFCATAR
ncbi:MAG: class I SAM-dependent methyltransferase [Ramlibacter sp.]